MLDSIKEVLITEEALRERVAELGKQISADYKGEDVVRPVIRHRQPGDRIVLRRRDGRIWGHKKLKDWLIDCKVATEERDALWFVCGDKVVFQTVKPQTITIVWDEQTTEYWACSIEEEK